MSPLRTVASAVLSSLCGFFVASGCGSDAVGVDACRDIEKARCEAGKHCGFVDDVDECQRFYRDHCLHGLKTSKAPGDIEVGKCVDSIKLAGACAQSGVEHLADCTPAVTGNSALTTPCDVVRFPEQIGECEFLAGPVEAGTPTKDTGVDAAPADGANEAASDGASEAASDAAGD